MVTNQAKINTQGPALEQRNSLNNSALVVKSTKVSPSLERLPSLARKVGVFPRLTSEEQPSVMLNMVDEDWGVVAECRQMEPTHMR